MSFIIVGCIIYSDGALSVEGADLDVVIGLQVAVVHVPGDGGVGDGFRPAGEVDFMAVP